MVEDLASGLIVAGLAAVGAYLKWAVAPVLIAFELGRLFERKRAYARRMRMHERQETAAR